MALDGIVIANLAKEIKERVLSGRITKIAQPEADAHLLTIKKERTTYRLFLSAGASLPLVYFTEQSKTSPATAPGFCMLLRKHIGNGRITAVTPVSYTHLPAFYPTFTFQHLFVKIRF